MLSLRRLPIVQRARSMHWTRNVIASPDGTKLYVTAGSNSNAGEQGERAESGSDPRDRFIHGTVAHDSLAMIASPPFGRNG